MAPVQKEERSYSLALCRHGVVERKENSRYLQVMSSRKPEHRGAVKLVMYSMAAASLHVVEII